LIRAPKEGEGLAGLLDGDLVGGLTSLELRETAPSRALAGLATSPRLGGLRRLSVSPRTDDAEAGLPGDLICAIVESPHLGRLDRLSLDAGGLGPVEAARFAALGGLSRLRSLCLWNCRLGEAGMRALARSPHLSGLRRLGISEDGGSPCLRALFEAPWLASLRELELRGFVSLDGIEDDDLVALASNPAVSRLRALHLDTQRITRRGTEALASSPYLGGLLSLNVGNVGVGNDLCEPLRERFGGRFVGCS
jgi:hypothetical protein